LKKFWTVSELVVKTGVLGKWRFRDLHVQAAPPALASTAVSANGAVTIPTCAALSSPTAGSVDPSPQFIH